MKRKVLRLKGPIAIVLVLSTFLGLMALYFEWSLRLTAQRIAVARSDSIINNAINQCAYIEEFEPWYARMVVYERDDLGRIQSVRMDGFSMNQLAGQLAENVEKHIIDGVGDYIEVSLTAVMGLSSLGVGGPRFRVECRALPSVDVDIESSFYDAGINQTKHALSARINTRLNFIVGRKIVPCENTTYLLLCETIIIGDVPSTYLEQDDSESPQIVLPLTP